MNEIWYKKLGFYANPLSIKPGMYDTDLVAYDVSSIIKKIDRNELVFIEGDYGTGKTTILKNIISNYKGKNRMIYFSFNSSDKQFDVNSLLDGARSFMKKITGLPEKNVIFLLDEVHLMKTSEAKSLIEPYKDGIIKSIVFVTHDYDAVNFPEELNKLLKNNIIKTVELTNKEAIELVRRRIGNIKIIDNKIIEKIYEIARKNPRRLLEYCEDVLKYTVEIGDDKVTEFHVNEVLKDAIKELKRLKSQKKENKKEKNIKKEQENLENMNLQKETIQLNVEKNLELNKTENILETKNKEIVEAKVEAKEKKFKVNKLIPDGNKNSLGAISEKENAEDKSEYKIYYVNE